MNLDLRIFFAINNRAGHSPILDYLGIFFADYLAYVLIIILAMFFLWSARDKWKKIVMLSVAFASAFIARFVVKSLILIFYDRPRPYVVDSRHLVITPIHKLISTTFNDNWQSFPSGHTIFFFALATALCFYDKRLGWWFMAAAALIGVARVFVGVHWPSDILAGAILGVLTAYVVQGIYLKWRRQIDPVLKRIFAGLLR